MEIVFVHLNTPIPIYLKHNLIRTRNIFPTEKIILISNIAQKSILGISQQKLPEPIQAKQLEKILSHPKEFRENFWHSSIARFAYLLSYQKKVKKKILHIESDVLIASDFPLSQFKRLSASKIAFPILAKQRGVASIFYSGSLMTLEKFVAFSISEGLKNSATTDMLILRNFYDTYPQYVKVLPAGPGDRKLYNNEIMKDIFPEINKGLLEFEGIFDGSNLGLYFFGTNPWNKRGISILRKEVADTYTKMAKFKIEFNSSRNFFDLANHGETIPIYNIHLTSKREPLFKTMNLEGKSKKFLKNNGIKTEVILKVFIAMLFKKALSLLGKIIK
jgi:hypothetical protein